MINLARILLMGLILGNGIHLAYSITGGLFAFLAMYLFKKIEGIHLLLVSAAGGIFHNVGQMLIGSILASNWALLFNAPFLLAGGILSGSIVGIISYFILKRLQAPASVLKE